MPSSTIRAWIISLPLAKTRPHAVPLAIQIMGLVIAALVVELGIRVCCVSTGAAREWISSERG